MSTIIKNECSNAPWGLERQVRRGIAWMSPADLEGIANIRLKNEIDGKDVILPLHLTENHDKVSVTGLYLKRDTRRPAEIILSVGNLYRGMPRVYWYTPALTLNICYTLAHEVGHHLIATRGYIFENTESYTDDEIEEEFCNRYAFFVTKLMMKRWYYRFGDWLLRDLANWYYVFGCASWKDAKFEEASQHFYTAFHLDRNLESALYWYRRAKDRINHNKRLERTRR